MQLQPQGESLTYDSNIVLRVNVGGPISSRARPVLTSAIQRVINEGEPSSYTKLCSSPQIMINILKGLTYSLLSPSNLYTTYRYIFGRTSITNIHRQSEANYYFLWEHPRNQTTRQIATQCWTKPP